VAEQPSKFAGALARLRPPLDEVEGAPELPRNEPIVARGRGRPPGKRSDPDFQPTTLLLRKSTKRTANRILEDLDAGQDLSELAEELLADWIRRHRA
jgi:hypothetical protein